MTVIGPNTPFQVLKQVAQAYSGTSPGVGTAGPVKTCHR